MKNIFLANHSKSSWQLKGREHGKYAAAGLEIVKRNKGSSTGVNWRARIYL